jgi:catechol 2,3-dioxygenase-like lactoylglutathione lyase family enzyme
MTSSLRGIHHTALNVADLGRSLIFYRDVLGLKPLFEPEEVVGPGFGRAMKIDGAKIKYVHLAASDGSTLVELIQFLTPKPKNNKLRKYDTGAPHIAFRVDDIDEAKERLEAKGVRFISDPVRIGDGPLKGKSFVYFSDPDGLVLELLEETT